MFAFRRRGAKDHFRDDDNAIVDMDIFNLLHKLWKHKTIQGIIEKVYWNRRETYVNLDFNNLSIAGNTLS